MVLDLLRKLREDPRWTLRYPRYLDVNVHFERL